MHTALLQDILNFILLTAAPLNNLGAWGYPAILLLAFVESLIIVGSFIPGSIGIIFAGFLAFHGYYNFWGLVVFAALGGVLGDWLSYYLGAKGVRFFRDGARFLKKKHIDRGFDFFEKSGDKSILLGRFTGPLRPVMPFVAGLSKMNKETFLFWNVFSAFIWVTFHLSLGYFFGTSLQAIERWSLFAGLTLLIVVGTMVALAILVQQRQKISSFLDEKKNAFVLSFLSNTYLGQFLDNHPRFAEWLRARFARHNFKGLPLTVLVVLFCYLGVIFFGIARQIVSTGLVSNFDERVLNFAINLYHANFAKWVAWFTSLGGEITVPIIALIAVLVFFFYKRKHFMAPLIFTGLFAEIFNLAGKSFFERLRPAAKLVNETSFSFPSGHATLSLAVYGFIVYVILRTAKSENLKIWSVVFVSIFIFLVGLSRLYLRVHYFSDVAGGFVLGGLSLIAGITLSEYFLAKKKE